MGRGWWRPQVRPCSLHPHLTLVPRYGARLPVAEVLPELLDDLTGAAAAHAMPARLAACFGRPQPSNPVCYVGAGGQATPLHFDPG